MWILNKKWLIFLVSVLRVNLKSYYCWYVKFECYSCRGNMKFFGIKEYENELNSDIE